METSLNWQQPKPVAFHMIYRDAAASTAEVGMSVLDTVEVIEGGQQRTTYDPVRLRRRKLAEGLAEQIKLIDALEQGETYRKRKVRKQQGLKIDEVAYSAQERAISPWWHVDDFGRLHFSLRYGVVRLKVKDDKDTFVLGSLFDLRQLLPPLRQEVLTGALDVALAEAATQLQARFTPRKAVKKA